MLEESPRERPGQPVLTLLRDLGLAGGNDPLFPEAELQRFAHRSRAFGLARLGRRHVPLHRLRTAICGIRGLRPPRSCHLGNLADIAAGRAGLADYEEPVLREGLNRPILFDLNQTDNADLTLGDTLYQPGSVYDGRGRERLDLHHWGGSAFIPADPDQSYLVPFVTARVGGELVPLTLLHRRRLRAIRGRSFGSQARFLHGRTGRVQQHLEALIEDALTRDNPERALESALDRWVTPGGSVRRGRFRVESRGLRLGDRLYPSARAVAEAAALPLRAAADPAWFLANVGALPGSMPLISNTFLLLELALLGAHWETDVVDRSRYCTPASPHVHWGGLSMVGTPPWRSGYVKKNAKRFRQLATVLVRDFNDLDPVIYVLAPTMCWALLGNDRHPADAEAVEALIRGVLDDPATRATDSTVSGAAVQLRVADWLRGPGAGTSAYFRGRFANRRSAGAASPDLPRTEPVYPASFWNLTTAQAIMLVGALLDQSGYPG